MPFPTNQSDYLSRHFSHKNCALIKILLQKAIKENTLFLMKAFLHLCSFLRSLRERIGSHLLKPWMGWNGL